ncbi:hypothetical protein EDD22DRAFT_978153 [Suillus occidentalis]|nr:hypothetical protein EDD22DRAFT_978153 [Suillus occidentalis]
MATDPFPQHLPTLDRLGVIDPSNVSSSEIAAEWLKAFSAAITQSDTAAIVDLFLEDGFWKDVIALTWDLRTFKGRNDIKKLLDARLATTGLHELCLLQEPLTEPVLQKVFPDFAWLRFCFGFSTKHGKGTGVVYLVPLPDSKWKAYTLLDLSRAMTQPVIVIGAGHSGLETAARLKYMGIPTLVIDKKPRVGDSWRDRYKALCLHDPTCSCFPPTWPLYTPAAKRLQLADWLEGYARFLELERLDCLNDYQDVLEAIALKAWTVEVSRGGKGTRVLTVKHLVFATGSGGRPTVPDIPGKIEILTHSRRTSFKGSTMHSSEFKSAANHVGKKAIVVGCCNSAHDIAQDFCSHVISAESVAAMLGAIYKDGFPIDLADTYNTSLPWAVVRLLHQRITPALAETADKEILDGLAKVGFKTNHGIHGAGIMSLYLERGGGYYIDTGASKSIIDGDIKIKSGSAIESFTENGLRFADGTELQADVIVFATGYGDPRDFMRDVCGDEVASKITRVWGLDEEGQSAGVWKYCGHDGLWFANGNFALSRFHSLHLALQIKAIEEGILNKADVVI